MADTHLGQIGRNAVSHVVKVSKCVTVSATIQLNWAQEGIALHLDSQHSLLVAQWVNARQKA